MLSFFPQEVLDEIWDLIESSSEVFSTFSTLNLLTIGPVPYQEIFDNVIL